MPRPKLPERERRSHIRHTRLRADEDAGLQTLAAVLGLPPSRIIRRLIREAINGGPDYFPDGVKEIRLMHVHLSAVGRNLNQLVKAVNRGELVASEDLVRVLDAVRLQVAGIEAHYLQAVGAAAWRAWRPLYREAGLPSPFDQSDTGPPEHIGFAQRRQRRRAGAGTAAG